MFCQKCGTNLPENSTECMTCGARVTPRQERPQQPRPQQPRPQQPRPQQPRPQQPRPQQPRPQQNWNQPNTRPVYNNTIYTNQITDESQLPEKFRPLGAWTYFALNLLFCIPIVGFIFLIVFSCSQANINRRNYARSFFCVYAIVGIILLIVLLAGGFAALS